MSDTPLKPEIQNLIEKGFNALTKADFKTAGLPFSFTGLFNWSFKVGIQKFDICL